MDLFTQIALEGTSKKHIEKRSDRRVTGEKGGIRKIWDSQAGTYVEIHDFKEVKDTFDYHFKHVKFDKILYKNILKWRMSILYKNQDHIRFFGSNLIGVYQVRFNQSDWLGFFDSIDVDPYVLKADIDNVEGINPQFNVSSDAFNLSCLYLSHRFLTEPKLSNSYRTQFATEAALCFNYKNFISLHSHYFKFLADERIVEVAYSRLTNRYLIKQLGSWDKVMLYRTKDIVDKKGIHYKKALKFKPTEDVVLMVNDYQGRLRDMLKNYYSILMEVSNEGEALQTVSTIMTNSEGEEVFKDKTTGVEVYTNYILSILYDTDSLVKEDLITVICSLVPNVNKRLLRQALFKFKEIQDEKMVKMVNQTVRDMIEYCFNYLYEKQIDPTKMKNLEKTLVTLKGLWLASRSDDPVLERLREEGFKYVQWAIKKKTVHIVATTRSGLYLYLFLRAIVKHQYG